MRTRSVVAVLALLALPAFGAGRQYVLEPQHVLTDVDRQALAAKGLSVIRALPSGRYLVRLAPDATVDTNDVRVRALTHLTAEKKVQASAYRVASQGRGFASLNVIFSDDVPFEDAKAAIEKAGGALDDVLATDFLPPQRIRARVPSENLTTLAADERVLTVYSGVQYKPRAYNQTQQNAADVTPLRNAPYNLDGTGLVLSYFELGPGDANHPEFSGRLINEYNCTGSSDTSCNDSGNKTHATHTGGTLIAAGVNNGESRGVAPKATLHGYRALCGSQTECGARAGADWLATKQNTLKNISSVADNNSWGVILGWDQDASTRAWTWYGFDEAIGGYEITNAALDAAARVNGSLMVHSAGNEAQTGGPQAAPFAHQHVDDNFNVIAGETFCYSNDGSGTDCPAPPTCSAGPTHCEIVRHPFHVPFGSVGLLACPKNILTVGATDNNRNIASFSSRGPTRDGRVKPEIAAPGVNVLSTTPNNTYGIESGTSMASPLTAGTAALLSQLWSRTFNTAAPPVALKTLLIAGAQDVGNPGPDYTYGFGFLDGKASADFIVNDGGSGKRIRVDNISQGGQYEVALSLASAQNLRVVLGWADPEVFLLGDQFADKTLVNDLDLKVIDPNGNTVLPYVLDGNNPTAIATRGVNTADNTEEVEIANAPAGSYRVIVTGTTVPTAPQQFVLIGNGDIGTAVPACTDPNEPNDTPTSAFGYLSSGVPTKGKICGQTDVDYFRVRSNTSNPITVNVTTGDTAVRVSFIGPSVAANTVDIGPNSTGSVQTALSPGISNADVLFKIEPIGTVGANSQYTVTATYTYNLPQRRRATK